MQVEKDLLAMQREFLAALRVPLAGPGREATHLCPRDTDDAVEAGFARTANRHLRPSCVLAPVERLDLYRHQYWYRTLDSLREDFPVLEALLGERGFSSVVEDYLSTTASRSFTLRHLGDRLAAFVAARTDLGAALALHASEVATLEYALCVAFESAAFAPATADVLESEAVALQPHVQLFALRTSASDTHRRVLAGQDPEPPCDADAVPSRFVAVFRDGFRPRIEALDADAWRLLAELRQGCRLGEALSAAGLPETEETIGKLQDWFEEWTARGWIVGAASFPRTAAAPRRTFR